MHEVTETDQAEHDKAKQALTAAGINALAGITTPYPKYFIRGFEERLMLLWVDGKTKIYTDYWLVRSNDGQYLWEDADDEQMGPAFNSLDEAISYFILSRGAPCNT